MLQRKTVAAATLELLKEISAIPELADLHLAGGTSLSLQIGHRISVDLDFFGSHEFSSNDIVEILHHIKPLTIISQNKNILILNIRGIKVDFVNYRYPLISTPLLEDNIRLLALPDIGAMKLAAVAGRGRKRDFYDLYFLLKQFSLRQILDFYNRKYEDGSEIMVVRSLTFFDDANEDEEPVILDKTVNWDTVKEFILNAVRKDYK